MSKKPQQMPAASTNTIRLHRVIATKPEKVYRAFLERKPWQNGCLPAALHAKSTT
jgi:hypothetical protein